VNFAYLKLNSQSLMVRILNCGKNMQKNIDMFNVPVIVGLPLPHSTLRGLLSYGCKPMKHNTGWTIGLNSALL
jgi:hypothetical protein